VLNKNYNITSISFKLIKLNFLLHLSNNFKVPKNTK